MEKEPKMLSELRSINIESIRALGKGEKKKAVKLLIDDLLMWSLFSNYEAIGVLEACKLPFVLRINGDEEEQEEPVKKEVKVFGKRYK